VFVCFFFQAEDGIRDRTVTGVQTCALPIFKEHNEDARLRTLDRGRLWAMETPQVFARDLIERAYDRVATRRLHVTDDAQAVERRSEERRVGKERRSRRATQQQKKKACQYQE